MAKLRAINKSEFAKKSWQRTQNYLFSGKDAACPLSAPEIPRAMMSMPIAFLCTDEEYSIVAVQGLQQETNFYVNADGKWQGAYIPAAYRGYPFVLAKNEAEDEQMILCINEESGLLTEDDSAVPFFGEDGELSPAVSEIFEFLSNVNAGLQTSARICKTLLEHELFKPWELQVQLEEGTKRVGGLFCIDEAALNTLSDEAFVELRQSGALPIIYCQLLSMQRISELAQFAQAKSKAESTPPSKELNFDGVNMDGNISFENL